MKKLWESLRGWLMLLLCLVGPPSLVIVGAVCLERSQPVATSWLLAVFTFGPYFYILFDGLYGDKIRKKRHLRGKLATWEAELAAKEKELNDQETRIDNLVKEKIIRQVQDISHRDYLISTPAFRELTNSKDLDRFSSVLTQDISIQSPFNITAEIYSKGTNSTYSTTLWECSCPDCTDNHQSPCKHMLRLAIEVGALISADNKELQEKLQEEAERLQEKTTEYNKAKEQAQRRLKKAEQKEKDVQHIMNENTLDFPFLTSLYADHEKIKDESLERYLWTKQNPAPHSAFLVQQIRHEKMAMAKECRANKYRLHLYHTAYPELKKTEKMTPKEAYLYLIAHTSNKNLPKPPDGVSFDKP